MTHKVFIPCAGVGSRLKEHTGNHINKALVSVNHKPVISHIVEKFPVETNFVIALGHKGQDVKDFLSLAYPERHFTFVENILENYMNFIHTGARGDIVYSLATVKTMGGGNFYFRKKTMLVDLKTLLEQQPYITGTSFKGPNVDIDLDLYRQGKDLYKQNLAQTFLDAFNVQCDLNEPWLENIKEQRIAEIVVQRSKNYHDKEEIDWKLLRPYAHRTLFIGFEQDYNDFCHLSGFSPKRKTFKDALDLAQIIKGSRLFIGNQSIGFALAEAMKHPRVLEVCYKKDNCRPNGEHAYTCLTPDILHEYVNDSYSLGSLPQFRSELGQDEWVLRTLKEKRHGYFIDIGASLGMQRNNTYVLEKYYEWSGICVDPHSVSFPLLQQSRECIVDNRCIADTEDEVDFFENKHALSESCIIHPEADYQLLKQAKDPKKIKAMTLMNLLKLHNAPKEIDYLSIDVQGAEWLILKDFDFNEYDILLITVDIWCPNKTHPMYSQYRDKRVRLKKRICSQNYHRVLMIGNTDFYAKQNKGFEIIA